jgi:hypothetical protein
VALTDETERAAEFPFAEWLLGVEDAGNRLTGRVRHCSRSAFVHLRKAWRLHGIDDEMSVFRAITAEEEAATALIQALKARRYAGAERLRPWNHVHKTAFWPLVEAVNRILVASGMPTPKVALARRGTPKVALKLDIAAMTGSAEPLWGEPDHPLNFLLRSGHASEPLVHMFEAEFDELASERGAGSLKLHVEREANARNRLLYADDQGYPTVTFHDDLLMERARRVGILVLLAIIVMQTPEHQLFVIQCLEALLRALASLGDTQFDYTAAIAPIERQLLTIHRHADGTVKASIRQPVTVGGHWGVTQQRPAGTPQPIVSSVRFVRTPTAQEGT